MKRLFKNLENILDIKLPKMDSKEDIQLIQHIDLFNIAASSLCKFIKENEKYITPKAYVPKEKKKEIMLVIKESPQEEMLKKTEGKKKKALKVIANE